ncbi:MAG: alpha/beta fold hydrolase [Sedimentisphaerales bacterium]|nr:alpha/beta fold hydrolase [Sedimentisphaerales bacterium]
MTTNKITSAILLALILFTLTLCTGCGEAFRNSQGITITYYYTQTADGKTLALRRYEPDLISAQRNPIILCHGLSYNLMFWDLDDQVSLARYLAQQGYDVWSLSLRGACPSSQPWNTAIRKLAHFNIDPAAINTLTQQMQQTPMIDWTVDEHIQYDIPAAIDFVLEQTERRRVHWIGHSMGGMIMFAYLSQATPEQADKIRTFVAAAVPMTVFHPLSRPMNFLVEIEDLIAVGSTVVGTSAPAGIGVIFGDVDDEFNRLFFNGRNMEDHVVRRLFQVAQEEISPGQLHQLVGMVRTEHFRSSDDSIDYTAALNAVNTPTCFLVGSVDNMATPDAVRYAYRSLRTDQRDFHLFGRVNGQRQDYGHDDLIIGEHSKEEVYPVILQWLERYNVRIEEAEFLLQPTNTDPATFAPISAQAPIAVEPNDVQPTTQCTN